MQVKCDYCGRIGELGYNIVALTGHETGSQRPITRYGCRDIDTCNTWVDILTALEEGKVEQSVRVH